MPLCPTNGFGIANIREFYAATEGNIAIFNLDSRPGAIGRIPKWAERRFVVKVVKFDMNDRCAAGCGNVGVSCSPFGGLRAIGSKYTCSPIPGK